MRIYKHNLAQYKSLKVISLLAIFLFSQTIVPGAMAQTSDSFQESAFATGLSTPTSMEFAPDGRLFVAEQKGNLKIIKNGVLLSTPFLTLNVDSVSERGLLGIAFDPNFSSNQYLYLYYTVPGSPPHNRVSRFTANGDVVVLGSEVRLLDLENLSAGNHNGGAIHFGLDGKLYIGVGENAVSSNSQNLGTRLGKILRINSDGTIPGDNPFVSMSGAKKEVWAYGFRNPFTFAIDPPTGKIYVNDVGQDTWEEVNLLAKSSNYGWPTCEGPKSSGVGNCSSSSLSYPIHSYSHSVGKAITGGTFYRGSQFPSAYQGSYFFGDYVGGWIKRLDINDRVSDFSSASSPVDVKVGPDGAIYYASLFGSYAILLD